MGVLIKYNKKSKDDKSNKKNAKILFFSQAFFFFFFFFFFTFVIFRSIVSLWSSNNLNIIAFANYVII